MGLGPTRQHARIEAERPGELDPTILSQCSTIFAMRLANDRDQQIIRAAIAEASASTVNFTRRTRRSPCV